jgi:ADP-ribose pyrophosphatase YjhB (NUDIX family)
VFLDPTPGGVVAAGESYEYTNEREIQEEMGIERDRCSHLRHLFEFYYEDQRVRCFGDAWEIEYDGPVRLQLEEVEEVALMSLEEILSRADKNDQGDNFTPDSMAAIRKYASENPDKLVTIGEKPVPVILPP